MMTMNRGSIKREGVETTTASTLQEDSLCGFVVDKKEIFMKFSEDIIVTNETINGKNFFANARNMENILQRKRSQRTS
jgi:hypothetical protein